MSTTTNDGRGLVCPTRRLIVNEGPWHLITPVVSSLLPGRTSPLILNMNHELPADVRPAAKNRFKFNLQIVMCGKTSSVGEYRLVCLLKDLIATTSRADPFKVVIYLYIGVLDDSTGRGFLDEYRFDEFEGNPMIRSLFPDWTRVFKTLDS